MLGKTVSHYKILEKIGEGGMGVVYKAEDTKLKRTVALKFLPPNLTKNEATRQRFINEAQAASALDHPNICNIHEIAEDENDQMYICMAYYEGQTLQDVIVGAHGSVPLPINESIDIFIQIAQGLAVAHEKNIIHRDIKPANILITDKGEVKIVDFGLAKLAGEKLTDTFSTKGTIAYMAPEIIRGLPGDQRADIWSLGVLLFEMLTGHLPFMGEYAEPMMYAIVNEEPESISTYLKNVPELLQAILNRLLKKNPTERYQSIAEMLIDFGPLVKETGSVKIKTRPAFTRKLFRKNSNMISIAAIFMVIMFIIVSKLFLFPEKSAGNSIAVLPFHNLGSDPDQEYLLYGIASQLIHDLNKVPGLRVRPYTSIINYNRENKILSEIGKELHAAYILDTRFQISGNQIQVIPELIEIDGEVTIWTQNYEREFDKIFDVQDDISQNIVAGLLDNLSEDDIEKTKTQRTENTEAYIYYLKGSHFFKKRFLSTRRVDDFKIAETMFKQAIELDPHYIPSYIELAELYTTYGWYIAIEVSYKERESYWARADTLRKLAYDLDPNSPEANVAMGNLYEHDNKNVNAFEKFKRAIELNPNCITCNHQIAMFLEDQGLNDMAFKYRNKIVELDFLDPSAYTNRAYGGYSYLGEYKKAESDFHMAFNLDPDHQSTLTLYSMYLIRTKKYEQAKEYCLRWSKKDTSALFPRAFIHALDGNKEEAINLTEKFSRTWEGLIYRDIIWIYTVLGKKEEAFEYLNKQSEVFAEGGWTLYLWLLNDPIYENLRSDPRFQEILKKHKELYEENLRKYGA